MPTLNVFLVLLVCSVYGASCLEINKLGLEDIFSPHLIKIMDFILLSHSCDSIEFSKHFNAIFLNKQNIEDILIQNKDRIAIIIVQSNASIIFSLLNEIVKSWSEGVNNKFIYYFVIWPEVITSDFEHEIQIEISNTTFTIDNDIYVIFPIYDRDGYNEKLKFTLFEFYSIKYEVVTKLNLTDDGKIDENSFLGKVKRRSDFQGLTISATAPSDEDYELEVNFSSAHDDQVNFEGGSAVQMFWFLRDSLNFTEQALVADGWLEEDENGSLSGSAIPVLAGEIDICISLVAMTVGKMKQLKFLLPSVFDKIHAYFVQPPASDFRNMFIAPFSRSIWIAMFLTLCFTLLTVKIVTSLTNNDKSVAAELYAFENGNNYEILIWLIGTICQQGWHCAPRTGKVKIIFIAGYFMGLLCYLAYSAAIVSTLSVKFKGIQDFDGLLSHRYQYYADADSTPYDFIKPAFKNHTVQYHNENSLDIAEVAKLIFTSSTVFLGYPDAFYMAAKNFSSECLCKKLSSLAMNRKSLPFAMFVKPGSQYTEFFNYKIISMLEYGLMNRYNSEYNNKIQLKCKQVMEFNRPLEFRDVSSAYFILFAGCVVSLCILSGERGCKYFQNR